MKRCILLMLMTALLLCGCRSGKEPSVQTQPAAKEDLPLIQPVETSQVQNEETLEDQPLGVVPEDLIGRWKTVYMTRYGEELDEQDLEEQGFWENLIITSEPVQGAQPAIMANYRQVYPADLGDNTYRLTIQDIPLSQWREELAGISTENQSWSAELEDVYGGNYFSYYLTLEDLDHLTLVLVRNFPEENVEQDHEIIKMVRMADDEVGIVFYSESGLKPDGSAALSKFDASGNWELVSGIVDGFSWEASDEGLWGTVSIYFEGNNPIVKYTSGGTEYPTMIPDYVEEEDGSWYFQAPEDWGGEGSLRILLLDENTLALRNHFFYDETIPVAATQFYWREGTVYESDAIDEELGQMLSQCPEDATIVLWQEPEWKHPKEYAWKDWGGTPVIIACAAPNVSVSLRGGTPVIDRNGTVTGWEDTYEITPYTDLTRGEYIYEGISFPEGGWDPDMYISMIIDGEAYFWTLEDKENANTWFYVR